MAAPRSGAEVETRTLRFASCRYRLDAAQLPAFAASTHALPPSLRRAALKRQIEFIAGRRCAERALRAAGCADASPLAIASDRRPLWPAGYTGSISHSDGLAIAAVSASPDIAVGLDVQGRLNAGQAEALAARIATADERRRLGAWPDPQLAISVLWALKESVYKALSRRIETPCGFDDVELLDLSVDTGEARLRLRRDLGGGLRAGSTHAARMLARRRHAMALCVTQGRPET